MRFSKLLNPKLSRKHKYFYKFTKNKAEFKKYAQPNRFNYYGSQKVEAATKILRI